MFETILRKALEVMAPYLFVIMVLFYSGQIIDLIKKAVGVKR